MTRIRHSRKTPRAVSRPAPAEGAKPGWVACWQRLRGENPFDSLLLLWPAWWALWLEAEGVPPWYLLLVCSAAIWLAHALVRVAAEVGIRGFRLSGTAVDGRPQPSRDARNCALGLLAGLLGAGLALGWSGHWLAVYLAIVPVLLAAAYPVVKRHSWLAQPYLGVMIAWSIPVVFAAVRGEVPPLGWLLFCAGVLWVSGNEIWRAMARCDDDLRAGVRSTAILLGDMDLVAQGLLYAGALFTLELVRRQATLGAAMALMLGLAALLVAYELWSARKRDGAACLRALLHGNGFGAIVLAGIVAGRAL